MVRVALEGLIGVGKSTVLSILQKDYGYDVAPEPVDQWTLLEQFYEDRPRYAMAFETQVLCSYAHKSFHAARAPQAPKPSATACGSACSCTEAALILERSPDSAYWVFANMLHKQGHISEADFETLGALYRSLPLAHVDKVIYISAPVEVCMQRLAWRDRANETSKVSEAYLSDLHTRYLEWLSESPLKFKLVSLTGLESPAEVAALVAEAIEAA